MGSHMFHRLLLPLLFLANIAPVHAGGPSGGVVAPHASSQTTERSPGRRPASTQKSVAVAR